MSSRAQRNTYYGGYTDNLDNQALASSSYGTKRKHVTFGPYYVGSTLGEGEFGKVKLGWTKTTSKLEMPKQVAIKLIRRDAILNYSEKETKIYREINALKHLTHPNIVKLEEVLQNSKYIGIVLEFASGGEFYKYIQKKRRLKETPACRLFAQLVSGVHYMHSKGLVHRDLKLENLLLDKHENLIITDFGFVNEFSQRNELMKTSCGSPCYAAPELVVTTEPYEARKADVWSCGIILYAMLAGYLPWDDDPQNPDGDDIAKLYLYITKTALKFPEYINPIQRDLLRKILVSDPTKRLNIRNIEKHEWLIPHTQFLSVSPEEWDTMEIKADRNIQLRSSSASSSATKRYTMSHMPTSADSIRTGDKYSISTTSRTEKHNSLVIDSSRYSLPAPAQESASNIMSNQFSAEKEQLKASDKIKPRTSEIQEHTRTNSAASVALQAVVAADINNIKPVENFDNITQTTSYNLTRPHSASNSITKKNSSSSYSTFNKYGTIMEDSSEKGSEKSTGYVHSNKNSHLRSDHKKPRPTSYHPGSSSAGYTDFLATYNVNKRDSNNEGKKSAVYDSVPSLVLNELSEESLIINKTEKFTNHDQNLPSNENKYPLGSQGTSNTISSAVHENTSSISDNFKKLSLHSDSASTQKPIDVDNSANKKRFSFLSLSSFGSSNRNLSSELVAINQTKPDASKTSLSSQNVTASHKNIQQGRDASHVSVPGVRPNRINYEASKRFSSINTNTRNTPNSNRSKRASVMVANVSGIRMDDNPLNSKDHKINENSNNNSTAREPHQNGQSTAKRVIDFFKRRSMRT
ncbi:hypothetical protein TPHA_0G01710 [Tetrapisispora phaffii CBS 4417]|uniref:non-specific serine/threonine protein kinase n=1 Tax=Tetrapisispora phaffii (strain ATCC 24235 / CBS 4417 / NBRC 1672 / NRRL Y-8282 / UCD 70-5) TaxID=1071381 RepID=G8BVS9_TETPH|nr:hypothetical protein TPHA_0G01710 [Tetrapisispora phaffii CBS 4417]CCE64007.1 hypothetical protein TPHA_0G01710 [Tetrapisispora phaffii CBS 4417]